jgi:hypothetical protein
MMRLARKASLLVAFCLLTSAATACAECAWVLWTNYLLRGTSPRGEWSYTELGPPEIFDTRAECLRVMLKYSRNRLKDEEDARKLGTPLSPLTFHCLPDTVDPRVKNK